MGGRRAGGGVRAAAGLCLAAAVAAAPGPARAHPAAASALLLDLGRSTVAAELQVPREALAVVFDLSGPPPSTAELGAYLRAHFAVRDAAGTALDWRGLGLSWATVDGRPHLVARMELAHPTGAELGALHVEDDVVMHELVTHQTLVTVRSDPWNQGLVHAAPTLAGTIRWPRTGLDLDRRPPSTGALIRDAFGAGAAHIGAGWDHLLFLLTLLLITPFRAVAGRWQPRAAPRAVVGEVVALVTAFSLGHGLTLALAAVGALAVPAALVELVVAGSIGLAAVHAIRPLWQGAERAFALGFGLVHGLAFAEVLSGHGTELAALGWTLLGFDLGVELVQLALAGLALGPLLWMRQRPGRHVPARWGLGLAALVAALVWGGQRLPAALAGG